MMRNKDKLMTLGVNQVSLTFQLVGAGAAAMTVGDDPSKVLNTTTPCTYNSASGDYTITFKDGFPNGALQSFQISMLLATPVTNDFAIKAVTLGNNTGTGATIRFVLYQSGSATDLAAADKAYFHVVFRDGVR